MSAEVIVSAIVPAFNADRFLAAALDSVLSQTQPGVEAVVVDDGSTDGTGAVADGFAARWPDRVRVVHQENQGFSLSRNAAMSHARGRYYALLDADDVWLPHHVARCVEVMEADARVGLVHADVLTIDADANELREPGRPRWRRLDVDPYVEVFLRREHIVSSTVVCRAAVIAEVGMFDPRFNRLGCEDRDLWLRIAEVSRLVYLDEVHTRYRWHGANVSANLDRMTRARRLLIDKHATRPRGRALRRRALAGVEADLGHELAVSPPLWPALHAFSRALAYDPLRLDAWKGLIRRIVVGRRPPRFSSRVSR